MNKKIAITTGDTLGIGEEITIKALNALNLPEDEILIIGKNINHTLNTAYETIEIDPNDNGKFCFESLKTASSLANEDKIKAIVTAPVSKEALHKSGYKYSGQTEILQKFLGNKDSKAEMMFISKDLRVLLLTRHLALKDIQLDKDLIVEKVLRTNSFLVEKCGISKPKFALCALNPHAGENGILGYEELDIMMPAVKTLRNLGINITDPLSADGLFAHVGENYLNNKYKDYEERLKKVGDFSDKCTDYNKLIRKEPTIANIKKYDEFLDKQDKYRKLSKALNRKSQKAKLKK